MAREIIGHAVVYQLSDDKRYYLIGPTCGEWSNNPNEAYVWTDKNKAEYFANRNNGQISDVDAAGVIGPTYRKTLA